MESKCKTEAVNFCIKHRNTDKTRSICQFIGLFTVLLSTPRSTSPSKSMCKNVRHSLPKVIPQKTSGKKVQTAIVLCKS